MKKFSMIAAAAAIGIASATSAFAGNVSAGSDDPDPFVAPAGSSAGSLGGSGGAALAIGALVAIGLIIAASDSSSGT